VINNLSKSQLKEAVEMVLDDSNFKTGSSDMLSQVMEMARLTSGFLVSEAEVKRLLITKAALMWCN
jgi:hypothetical protein